MSADRAFELNFSASAPTISVSVTATASTSAALPGKGNSLRVVNEGIYAAFLSVGSGSQTATTPSGTAATTCTPILPGEDLVFSIPNDQTYNFSLICRAAQTATVLLSVGEGQ